MIIKNICYGIIDMLMHEKGSSTHMTGAGRGGWHQKSCDVHPFNVLKVGGSSCVGAMILRDVGRDVRAACGGVQEGLCGELQDGGSGGHVRAVLLLRTVGGSKMVIEVLASQVGDTGSCLPQWSTGGH